ncbi:hypothetical protein [Oleiphilus sp. HI0125]|uniref:beta strand repeat-containing protein n=3 Tax=Oleiphilus sp. HI0125 TaxID=1822266 RepID=UPI0012E8ACEA|nr:hypothetical protein [Oleiphilus sp. HI0125]
MTVTINPVIDGPNPVDPVDPTDPIDPTNPSADGNPLTGTVSTLEDTEVDLELGPLTAVDSTETISSVTIGGVPTGAILSAGTNNGDGTWTVDPADLDGLSLTPVEHSSDDFTLTTAVTFTQGDVSKVYNGSVEVTLEAVADAPAVSASDVNGDENSAIALDITGSLADNDGSESVTGYTISDVPLDATLSAGTDNGDGSWTLTAAELAGLTITPAIGHLSDIVLQVTIHNEDVDPDDSSQVDSNSATTSMTVTINPVIDGPNPVDPVDPTDPIDPTNPSADGNPLTGTVSTLEDTEVDLELGPLTAVDSTETISSVTIGGVPTGAILSAGTNNGDGTWTVDPADLDGLSLTPVEHSSDDFTLTTEVTFTQSGASQVYNGSVEVTVEAVADTPIVAGASDGVSSGAATGQNLFTNGDLQGTPVNGFLDGMNLSGWSTEFGSPDVNDEDNAAGGAASGSWINTPIVSGNGGTWVGMGIMEDFKEGISQTVSLAANQDYMISFEQASFGLQTGHLMFENNAYIKVSYTGPNGVNTLIGSSSVISAPASWDMQTMTFTAPESGSYEIIFEIANPGAAELAYLEIDGVEITEVDDASIALDITSSLTDNDGSESITGYTISGVPLDATLSAGTDNGTGVWTLTAEDVADLSITPAADYEGDIDLQITVYNEDVDPDDSSQVDSNSATTTLTISVEADEDALAPTLNFTLGDEQISAVGSIEIDNLNLIHQGVIQMNSNVQGSNNADYVIITGTQNNAGGVSTFNGNDLIYVKGWGNAQNVSVDGGGGSGDTLMLNMSAVQSLAPSGTTSGSVTFVGGGNLIYNNIETLVQDTSDTVTMTRSLSLMADLATDDGSESLSPVTFSGFPSGVELLEGNTTLAVSDGSDFDIAVSAGVSRSMTIEHAANVNVTVSASVSATNIASGDTATTQVSQVIDDILVGLEYETSSGARGVTDAEGIISFDQRDTIRFSVGAVVIGELIAANVQGRAIFLTDFQPVNGAVASSDYLTNMAVFLQSIDSNQLPDDGILIEADTRQAFALNDADLALLSLNEVNVMLVEKGFQPVEPGQALQHVSENLAEYSADNTAINMVELSLDALGLNYATEDAALNPGQTLQIEGLPEEAIASDGKWVDGVLTIEQAHAEQVADLKIILPEQVVGELEVSATIKLSQQDETDLQLIDSDIVMVEEENAMALMEPVCDCQLYPDSDEQLIISASEEVLVG